MDKTIENNESYGKGVSTVVNNPTDSASGIPPENPTEPTLSNGSSPIPNNPTENSHNKNRIIQYLFIFIALSIGISIGFFLNMGKEPKNNESVVVNEENEIKLPPDAIRIQGCANKKGALFVRPNDIPVGPVFMVNNGKVIGIEFMLGREEFLSGKSYEYLSVLGKINHANIGLFSKGHEGYIEQHYHVDLYLVSKEEAGRITCPNSAAVSTESNSQTIVDEN